jgi:hypothetical protein
MNDADSTGVAKRRGANGSIGKTNTSESDGCSFFPIDPIALVGLHRRPTRRIVRVRLTSVALLLCG